MPKIVKFEPEHPIDIVSKCGIEFKTGEQSPFHKVSSYAHLNILDKTL